MLARVEHLRDRRVLQRRDQLPFRGEAQHRRTVAGAGAQHLDRDFAAHGLELPAEEHFAERTFAESQAEVAEMNGRVSAAQIDLFRALGGGWGQAA